jgi:sigma-B regulation protein RsbU (phosphoserine phosphatase)
MTVGPGDALEEFIEALGDDDPQHLYDNAPCGYLTTDADGLIRKTNQTFLTLTGYTRDELVGRRRFAELLSRGGQIFHETHYAPMLRMHGAAREIALDVMKKDGSRLPVLVNAVLERDHQEQPTTIRTAVFAAAQRRQYEDELLNAKRRAEQSQAQAVALARTLQATLIPPTPPRIPFVDVAAAYRPAGDGTQVGGDFYDVFQLTEDEWVVVLGDVCGKGAEAAVVTALARYTLRAAAVEHDKPSQALATLNHVMLGHETDRFCTVVLLRLRRDEDGVRCVLASGGHPLPLLRRADGRIEEVGRPGSLVGILEHTEFEDVEALASPGATLLLYTDGVVEARRNGDQYGMERLTEVLHLEHATAEGLVTAVVDDVLTFQGGSAADDIAVLALRVPG